MYTEPSLVDYDKQGVFTFSVMQMRLYLLLLGGKWHTHGLPVIESRFSPV